MRGALTSYIDVAQVTLYAFWIFFAGLIFYLRREDRREGYPLESEVSGAGQKGFLLIPSPKEFLLAHGGSVFAPRDEPPRTDLSAEKVEPWPGAPFRPVGDPFKANVGPGSYALRADTPDLTWHGDDKIVPLRVATAFEVCPDDPDPRGMSVVGADGRVAGTVSDVWVDRSEIMARYYEVAVGAGESARRVLLPVPFARIDGKGRVHVDALLADQFGGVPTLKSPDRITMLEEERVAAYYGAGKLYATPARAEPLL